MIGWDLTRHWWKILIAMEGHKFEDTECSALLILCVSVFPILRVMRHCLHSIWMSFEGRHFSQICVRSVLLSVQLIILDSCSSACFGETELQRNTCNVTCPIILFIETCRCTLLSNCQNLIKLWFCYVHLNLKLKSGEGLAALYCCYSVKPTVTWHMYNQSHATFSICC